MWWLNSETQSDPICSGWQSPGALVSVGVEEALWMVCEQEVCSRLVAVCAFGEGSLVFVKPVDWFLVSLRWFNDLALELPQNKYQSGSVWERSSKLYFAGWKRTGQARREMPTKGHGLILTHPYQCILWEAVSIRVKTCKLWNQAGLSSNPASTQKPEQVTSLCVNFLICMGMTSKDQVEHVIVQ